MSDIDTGSSPYSDPFKIMTRLLDAAVVAKGGKSIFTPKPRGTLSEKASRRIDRWAYGTPHVSLTTPGPRPGGRPQDIKKPGRLVAGMTGKLGGYASDLDDFSGGV